MFLPLTDPLPDMLEDDVAAEAASLQTLLSVKLLWCMKRTSSQAGKCLLSTAPGYCWTAQFGENCA